MILEYLIKRGYNPPDKDWYSTIDTYLCWYQNEVPGFHDYNVYNGTVYVGRQRYRLGMAKTICEDHADLLLNEKTVITAEGFKGLDDILSRNNFYVRANQLVEIAFALGTGAFVEFRDAAGLPDIDYIRADMIFPLSWDNGTIKECAFASYKQYDSKPAYYLQIHRLENGKYVIENVYLDKTGAQLPAPKGVQPLVNTGSPLPLFQIVSPNIVNNAKLDCPMGISVYGNSLTQLQATDLVYDSYVNDFEVGRARLMVPQSMAQLQMQQDGTIRPLFDPSDSLFYVYQHDPDGKNELKEFVMTLRSEAHETAIQRQLDLLSKKCGLGSGRYRFESGAVKTATEVISDKSDLYQVRQKNEIILKSALVGLVRSLSFLSGGSPDVDVNVSFDDSIIEDSKATVDKNILLVNSGLRSRAAAIMEIDKIDQQEAEKRIAEIDKSSTIGGAEIEKLVTG